MTTKPNITADAVALQERDEFRADGWLKVLAPAKVNLHLAIGPRRADGYHEAATVMHALNLHDVVYLRELRAPGGPGASGGPGGPSGIAPSGAASDIPSKAKGTAPLGSSCRMVAGDPSIELPDLAPEDNIAARAVAQLAEALGRDPAASALEIRIEKNVPAQAGLGGGSGNAAAALVGAAQLWGVDSADPANAATIERVARELGADVAFFLHGGCAYLEGAGDEFVRALEPSRQAVALVKPDGGVSTAAAYRAFDERPDYALPELAAQVAAAADAADVALFNNLAPASEALMPELAEVRAWLEAQPGAQAVLLCGSGAATFALCDTLAAATSIAAAARARGWWSRATSLGPLRAVAVPSAQAAGTGATGTSPRGGAA